MREAWGLRQRRRGTDQPRLYEPSLFAAEFGQHQLGVARCLILHRVADLGGFLEELQTLAHLAAVAKRFPKL